jgi:hypothetical protein
LYRSCTWLCPLCFPSGESTNEPGSLVHLIFVERVERPGKSSTASAVANFKSTNFHQTDQSPKSGARKKIDAEHFFAGSPQQCELQLYFHLFPRAQHSWQNAWVTSERMIHSSSSKKSVFSRAFTTKRQYLDTADRYANIVHAPRNNTLFARGVITRRGRFWPKNWAWSRIPH